MKTVFEKTEYNELKDRIQKLNKNSTPRWGKMNVAQMLHHLNLTMEAPLGLYSTKGKPIFLMRPFKSILYNDKPFKQGDPTPKDFKIVDAHDFEIEQVKAMQNLDRIFETGINGSYLPHVFFGTLTREQWGMHFYKHTDHHLRQFSV